MNNVINWLLNDDTPEVKFRAMTELLGMSKDELEVKKAYENLFEFEYEVCENIIVEKFGIAWILRASVGARTNTFGFFYYTARRHSSMLG
ncbi:MAG: hypothetical protein K0R15_553 [Clostridiales bacterium]|nr:hypothetical protein [Clostridiales bacterium]